jgi:hypothetical protein
VDAFGYMIDLCIYIAIDSATSASGSDAISGSHCSITSRYITIKMHSIQLDGEISSEMV